MSVLGEWKWHQQNVQCQRKKTETNNILYAFICSSIVTLCGHETQTFNAVEISDKQHVCSFVEVRRTGIHNPRIQETESLKDSSSACGLCADK